MRAQQSDACGVVALAPKEVCNRVLAQKNRPREEVREVRRGLGEGGEREHAGPPLRLVDVLEPDAKHVLDTLRTALVSINNYTMGECSILKAWKHSYERRGECLVPYHPRD